MLIVILYSLLDTLKWTCTVLPIYHIFILCFSSVPDLFRILNFIHVKMTNDFRIWYLNLFSVCFPSHSRICHLNLFLEFGVSVSLVYVYPVILEYCINLSDVCFSVILEFAISTSSICCQLFKSLFRFAVREGIVNVGFV